MPKIAVNENYDPRPREYDVGFPRKVLYMLPKPQSPFMKLRSDKLLKPRILSLDT